MGLTLRDGDREYFYSALDKYFPGLKEKYTSTFGLSYELPSPDSGKLFGIFKELCERFGIMTDTEEIFEFLRSDGKVFGEQLKLFN